MIGSELTIQKLEPKDAGLYKEIRLEALLANPEAFGSSFEIEKDHPLSWFEERLVKNTILGAFRGTDLLGVAGFFIQSGMKTAHKGVLWGMYVRATARGTGVGKILINAVIDHAKSTVELIQLTVVSDNLKARSLYKQCGFEEYGLEKKALKHAGHYYDEFHMVYFFPSGS
jgi:RimJ/RimL family protein N-acetyltransferase